VIGFLLVDGLEFLGHLIFPSPADLDVDAPDFYERVMREIPLGAMLMILLALAIGVTAAAAIAARLAPNLPWVHGSTVGTLFLIASIVTIIAIPHPLWLAISAIAINVLACAFGCWLGSTQSPEPSVAP